MHFLSSEQRNQIFLIMNDSYYIDRVNYLSEFLEKTRDPKIKVDPDKLLSLQFEAANFETKVWQVMAEQREIIKDLKEKNNLTEQEQKDLERTRDNLESHIQLLRILHTIFDGVAWRSLKYNRLFLTSAARSTTSGAFNIHLKSSESLFSWAYSIQKDHKGIVLINDLTRFLRIGDLTEVFKNTAVVHELKKNGERIINFKTLKLRKGAKISDQTRKMLELQQIAFTGKIILDDGAELEQRFSQTKLDTHFSTVESLLETSKQQIVARRQLEPFIQLSILNLEKAYTRPHNMKKYFKSFRYTGWSTQWQLSHTNYDHFFYDELGNFIRNQAPFSIYPLSNELCMKLMSGQILIKSTINYELLIQELRCQGWQTAVNEPNIPSDREEKLKHIFDNKKFIFANVGDDDGFIKIKRGPFDMVIPQNWIAMMSMEFMTFETLCNTLEEIYRQAIIVQAPMTVFPEFPNSEEVWN